MTLALDNPQDIWGHIKELEDVFQPRDALLDDCARYLVVAPLKYLANPEQLEIETEDAKGYLQVQTHLAIVRVHLPFSINLPPPYDLAEVDKTRLENAECMGQGLLEEALQRRTDSGGRPGSYDSACNVVQRGAVAGFAYWQELGKGNWRPCFEAFDPRGVWFQSDERGICFYAVRGTMPEYKLARYVKARASQDAYGDGPSLWNNPYNVNGKQEREFWRVWGRDGDDIYWGMVGQAGENQKGEAVGVAEPHVDEKYRELPVFYVPCGGTASESVGTSVGRFTYGAPFITDMRSDADAINILKRELMSTAALLATAPYQKSIPDAEGDAKVSMLPGAESTTGPGVTITPLRAAWGDALPAIANEIARHQQLIEMKGLSYQALGMLQPPRSELLRRGQELAALQSINPYIDGYTAGLRMSAQLLRSQAQHLLETRVLESIKVNGPNKRRGPEEPAKVAYDFKLEDLYWDGRYEITLSPPATAETAARLLQAAVLKKQTFGASIPNTVLLEELGYEQPAKLARQARQEHILEAMRPSVELFDFTMMAGRLARIEAALQGQAAEQRRALGPLPLVQYVLEKADSDYLLGIVGGYHLDLQPEDDWLEGVHMLQLFADKQAQDLRQRLIPQEQAKARSESATGGAPAPNPTMSPEVSPSQGSPAGDGYQGGGGLDDLSQMVGALRGSQRSLMPPEGGA